MNLSFQRFQATMPLIFCFAHISQNNTSSAHLHHLLWPRQRRRQRNSSLAMILFIITLLLAFPINAGHALPGPRQQQQQPQRTNPEPIQSSSSFRKTSSNPSKNLSTNNDTSSHSWFFRLPVTREMENSTTTNGSSSSSNSLSLPPLPLPLPSLKVDSFPRSSTKLLGRHSHNRQQNLPSPSIMNERMICLGMAISGMVESICLHKFGCFPNLMTGITVKSLDGLAGGDWATARFGFSMVTMYILGGMYYQSIVEHAATSTVRQRRPTKSQIPYIVRRVAWMSALCFVISDLLQHHSRSLQLPLLSLGFGAINAFGSTVWGGVTNAVTGHWTKMGLGLSEQLFHQIWSYPTNRNSTNLKHIAASRLSAKAMASFVLSLFTTSVVLRRIDQLPTVLQTLLRKLLPPLGTSLAIIYTFLLKRYADYHQAYDARQEEMEQAKRMQ